ncbi:MAG: DUF4168 domain-containing protein [Cyclonatronaceae bacterium]
MVIFGAASAHAQFEQPAPPEDMPEVTDQELQIFVDASIKAQQIQNEAQIEMVAIVEEEELDVETYNKILQGMQMEQSAEEMEVSESDVEKFESASGKIGEIEMEMEDKLVSAIEEEGLELDRFQEIFMTVQTDPELQQKMQQMLQESQMQQE